MNKQLSDKLKTLPKSPGVYFHKSKTGEIIYVGKAAVLRNRVRQYFQKSRDMDTKTRALVAEIADTDWIETESEIDALFLESEMVKRYMPRYNILLRDDKSSIYVRINLRDTVPYVSFTRQPIDDGAEYYGPFYSGFAIKNALRYLRKVFPYFTKPLAAGSRNSKLNAQLGLTPDIVSVPDTLTPEYRAKLAIYRKDLQQLISYVKGNRVAVMKGIEREMKSAATNQDFERAAKLRNQLYNLNELRRQIVFGREEFLDASRDQALSRLCELLKLPEIPRRIEAFDVSHISGTNNVASMVVATNGVADRREYRKFRLRTGGNDDYAHMRETISRRLKHLRDWGRPDLVIVDGGAGQLGAVAELLRAENIPFIGRNKSGDHTRNAPVVIVVPNSDDESMTYKTIPLESDDHVAKLIARLDDESHRFAISYHQTLRGKSQTKNVLEEIPSVGPSTRKKLVRAFGSVTGVKNASEVEIARVVGQSKASIIKQNLS